MPGIGMSDWGPATWNTLHAIAHTLPDDLAVEERARLRHFLFDVAHYLPCKLCGRHFATFVTEHATDARLATRTDVIALLHDAHNSVNRRLGRPLPTLDEHNRMYARNTHPRGWSRYTSKVLSWAALCAGVIVIVACAPKKIMVSGETTTTATSTTPVRNAPVERSRRPPKQQRA